MFFGLCKKENYLMAHMVAKIVKMVFTALRKRVQRKSGQALLCPQEKTSRNLIVFIK